MCIEHPWITDICDYILFLCACLLIVIMQRVQKDRVCRMDKPWIRRSRRAAYILEAGAALIAAMNDVSPASLLLLLICTTLLLAITAIAQAGRPNGHIAYRTTVTGSAPTPLATEIYALRKKEPP